MNGAQEAVDVVAAVLAGMFGHNGANNGIEFRARQIVAALQKAGHLPGTVDLDEVDVRHLPTIWSSKIEVMHVPSSPAEGECWLWRGAIAKQWGYGRVRVNGRTRYTHSVMYEFFIGPIPDGLQIDHLCRQRACCAPHHLEAVTCKENIRRMRAARPE